MKLMLRSLILSLLIITLNKSFSQTTQIKLLDKATIENKIDALFSKYQNEPGISIGIVFQDSLLIHKQYGLANLEHNMPITNKTSFHVASVSKQFTAFAILLLEQEGKLSLSDDIRVYLPELAIANTKVSLLNLLNHTSGYRDQWNILRLAGWRLDDVILNDQVLDLIYRQQELNFTPNDEFMYSNSGYTLLAEIVARVSGRSFADFAKERIFAPLGMHNTLFVDDANLVVPNKAHSYYKHENEYFEDLFNNASVGATNLSTTLEDLSKWTINFSKTTVGSDAIFKKMHTPGILNNGNSTAYGLGQFIDTYMGLPRISHSGLDASYQAYIGRFPNQNVSLIIVSNNSSINGGRVINQISELCLKDYSIQSSRASAKKENKRKIPIRLNRKMLKYFEGFYWNKKDRYSREIIENNDTLYYSREDGSQTALIPVGDNNFEMAGDESIALTFKNNSMKLVFDDGYTIDFNKYIPAHYTPATLKEYSGFYYAPELNTYYSFRTENGQLLANHQRHGDFKLKAIMQDYFIGTKGSFREVLFERDANGKLIGFRVSSSRAKNILFKKVMQLERPSSNSNR